MIKNLPTLDEIDKMSYFKLMDLKRSLKEKIKVRRVALNKNEANYDAFVRNNPNATTLDKLELGNIIHIKSDLLLLESTLSHVEKRLEPMLAAMKQSQPGGEDN